MSLFSIWPQFGFRENPYSHETLPANEEGDYLLVGRDREVQELQRKIGSGGTHASLEGPIGVGKSSLLAVAGYRMAVSSVQAGAGELYLPALRFFQASEDIDKFEAEVYWTLMQTLIENVDAFHRASLPLPDTAQLDKWLNSPQYRDASGQLSVLGTGAGAGGGSTPNTSEGFQQSGFPSAVREQLDRCFPGRSAGGIVCVLDNLELLQDSQTARSTLDAMRDRIFDIPQLRWVLCGSRGIVSRARSERLSGVFEMPMRLGPLEHEAAVDLVARRIEHYGTGNAVAPVTPTGFEFIYRAINKNLRDALSYAHQFAEWMYTEYLAEHKPIPPEPDRDGLLEVWMTERADQAFDDARGVQARAWQFFQDLAKAGGRAGSAEWERFGYTHQQQMTNAVTQLADVNLMVRETDPENAARTVNAITAQGWLVYFNRNRYTLPEEQTGSTE